MSSVVRLQAGKAVAKRPQQFPQATELPAEEGEGIAEGEQAGEQAGEQDQQEQAPAGYPAGQISYEQAVRGKSIYHERWEDITRVYNNLQKAIQLEQRLPIILLPTGLQDQAGNMRHLELDLQAVVNMAAERMTEQQRFEFLQQWFDLWLRYLLKEMRQCLIQEQRMIRVICQHTDLNSQG